jgi:uncharacterized membrane protein YphA (DoxX/SURF4 family)
MYKRLSMLAAFGTALCTPLLVSAHEVYVLTPGEISYGLRTPPFDMFDVVQSNIGSFFLWGFVAAVVVLTVFAISITRSVENVSMPFLLKLKRYAPIVARLTGGIAFLSCAYYGALFGPELPLGLLFGSAALVVRVALGLIGICFLINRYVLPAAIASLLIFVAALFERGTYMLTYTNYFGEILAMLLGLHGTKRSSFAVFDSLARKYSKYTFPVLRICFGISLIDASLYAKVFHNVLALQVASLPLAGHAHSLAYYLGFEPHFVVLGAAIIELIAGLLFILGIEIRHTALFLLFWLSLSLWYFGESVWPHLILFGVLGAFVLHGYDRYSLEGYFFMKRGREPML